MNKNIITVLTKYLSIPVILIIILIFIVNTKNNKKNHTYIPISRINPISYTEAHNERLKESTVDIKIGGHNILAKLANTTIEQNIGLMQKKSLNINQGMLFTFKHSMIHDFWMAYTKIPLDMIFISSQKKIKQIIYATPCTGNTCMEYIPKFNSLYVLEVNPTLIKRFNIRVGDDIFFN